MKQIFDQLDNPLHFKLSRIKEIENFCIAEINDKKDERDTQ